MKQAILTYVDLTGADNKYSEVVEVTLPFMRDYARKCQAAFILPEQSTPKSDKYSHRAAMNLHRIDLIRNALNTYDRVLWLDADVLIRPDSPSLFSLVPPDCFAAHDNSEVNWTARYAVAAEEEHKWFNYLTSVSLENGWGEVDPSLGVIDSGVLLANQDHRRIFTSPWGFIKENPHGSCEEMIWINVRLAKIRPKMYYLPDCFNKVIWNGHYQPEKSNYFLHYAGYDVNTKIELAKKHAKTWRETYA